MEDKSKVAKSERTRQVHLGKRKQVDKRILDLQKIINKMVSVDRIANEFYLLDMKMREELNETIESLYNKVWSLQTSTSKIRNETVIIHEPPVKIQEFESMLQGMKKLNQDIELLKEEKQNITRTVETQTYAESEIEQNILNPLDETVILELVLLDMSIRNEFKK
jgi:hypothetical protein